MRPTDQHAFSSCPFSRRSSLRQAKVVASDALVNSSETAAALSHAIGTQHDTSDSH